MYACGPTVYDHPHLGHARQAMTYDIVRRYLEWRGVEVVHVANVTDIDDNIIGRAAREGRSEAEVAAQWEAIYIDSMDALGILAPHHRPRATEYVPEMLALIETLVDNGAAYVNSGGLYLRVGDVRGYGDLVHRSLDELHEGAGARINVDEDKENPLDFALWKSAKPGEPTWPSPWGDGRPGWHIECAAMSLAILGDGFDLHGGGSDLVFPHHTNERAEAIAAGRVFASHWMHNAMVNVDGTKMSKSLGNYTTIGALLDEHPLNARALRLLILQTHYRKAMEVNTDVMAQARSAIRRLDAMARKAVAAGIELKCLGYADQHSALEASAIDEFVSAMDDDLGTPAAIAVVFATARRANAALDSGSANAATLVATVTEEASALGLQLNNAVTQPLSSTIDDTSRIDSLVRARQRARSGKDFDTADRIRSELAALGVVIEDTPSGPIWRRS